MPSSTNRAADAVQRWPVSKGAIVDGKKRGLRGTKLAAWIKRKVECIHVVRMRNDGQVGCSVPCLRCRRLITAFDLCVVCTLECGTTYKGKLDIGGAPVSKWTSGQKREIDRLCAKRAL